MNGVFIIDKPEGLTSHDVVQRIRKKFNTSKVGHLGTLDPMATGVLPVCIGKATRFGQYLASSPKEYVGQIRFGFSTTTYDREGSPTSEERLVHVTIADIDAAMHRLTGELDQIPPPFSAKKFGGIPAHRFARRGQAIDIAPVRVVVERFEVLEFDRPTLKFHVVCSPGTYVRSLAHDLGHALGCGAHLTSLCRIRSGDFRVEEAVALGKLRGSDLLSLDRLLDSWPRIEVEGTDENRVLHGNPIPANLTGRFARIFNKKGEFLAVGSIEKGLVCPKLVLTSFTSD